ncbi:MAG TPA: hypothetical protein PKL83_04675 [bacterium]|nr:hypothetical protein [bacterium]
MRKQYYFEPSPHGYYAWDVDRLIEKASRLPVIPIKLADIKELDEDLAKQGTGQGNLTWRQLADHMRLVEEADLSYPILLSADNRVMDGIHRIVKALLRGQTTIQCKQFPENPPADYVDVQETDLPY